MGKRSDFPRRAQDDYPTPPEAVTPLLPHLQPGASFTEPCVGAGQLARTLTAAGFCLVKCSDLPHDARYESYREDSSLFITNPPWTRPILHPIIDNLRKQKPTWLLLDADWAHTRQAAPYLPFCHKLVAIGRVKWVPDSPYCGKDNCAWYLFDQVPGPTVFFGLDGRRNGGPEGNRERES